MTDLAAMTERQRHVMLGPDQTAWISTSTDSDQDDTVRWLREILKRLEQAHA